MGNKRLIVVKGTSMMPEIPSGALVALDQDVSELAVGDIVAYEAHPALILHRIVGVVDDRVFITKGDASRVPDSPIRRECVIGKFDSVLDRRGA